MVKVGRYVAPDENGEGQVIYREFYGQGMIFKDEEAFSRGETEGSCDDVCYIPELSDTLYSYNDFLEMCKGEKDIARWVFDCVDWQHPETYIDEMEAEGELDVCKQCGRMFLSYGKRSCPRCHAMRENSEVAIDVDMELILTNEDIDDIMATALEGGVNYWCRKVKVIGGEYFGEYASDQISRDGSLDFYLDEPFDESGKNVYRLSLKNFETGVKEYVKNSGMCEALMLDKDNLKLDVGSIDSCAADSIIQYALFGVLVYG